MIVSSEFRFCLRRQTDEAGAALTQIEAAEDLVTICNAIDQEEQAVREELELETQHLEDDDDYKGFVAHEPAVAKESDEGREGAEACAQVEAARGCWAACEDGAGASQDAAASARDDTGALKAPHMPLLPIFSASAPSPSQVGAQEPCVVGGGGREAGTHEAGADELAQSAAASSSLGGQVPFVSQTRVSTHRL
jgi:hypothetical protein